jgi:signal peptidase I
VGSSSPPSAIGLSSRRGAAGGGALLGRRSRLDGKRPKSGRPVGAGSAPAPSLVRRLAEWVAIVAIALVAAFLVKTFVLEAFYIPSGSMEPTLMVGDRILVDKLSYDMHPVHRGDIVVFKNPIPHDQAIKDLVKRVIGLPGDEISSNAAGQVLIDGHILKQPWLPPGTDPGPPVQPQRVRPGYVFVMGDNRGESEDSRAFGQVPESTIVGRVILRVWPLSRLRFF